VTVTYEWRGDFANAELNALHAEGFDHVVLSDDEWDLWEQVNRHSLGWVTARDDGALVGFVNVAWDGCVHAFILDTVTAQRAQRQGVGTRLVKIAEERARAQGCEWLHVDFEPHLRDFYFEACGFEPTEAGLIRLA
jgi:GNAT superfamily N-acetyltransferase